VGEPRKSLLLDCPVVGRVSWLSLERGRLEVEGYCLALVQEGGVVEIPPAAFAALLIEPGVVVTHAAVRLCAENLTQMVWVGEAGVRIYSASHLHADADRLLSQARLHLNIGLRVEAARRLYALMFSESAPPSFTLEKLRGIEGAKVRAWYRSHAQALGIEWDSRSSGTDLQQCISFASGCLYNLSHVAVVLLGYSPCIGVVHSGDARSFVYDVADTVKFEMVIAPAMAWFSEAGRHDYASVRAFCRDLFRRENILDLLIRNAEHIVSGNGSSYPE
jgi:CRISPR-associated protein Cas1